MVPSFLALEDLVFIDMLAFEQRRNLFLLFGKYLPNQFLLIYMTGVKLKACRPYLARYSCLCGPLSSKASDI